MTEASAPPAASRLSRLRIDRSAAPGGRKRRRWGLWVAVAIGIATARA
jgi:hypothetical protein